MLTKHHGNKGCWSSKQIASTVNHADYVIRIVYKIITWISYYVLSYLHIYHIKMSKE